MNTLSYFLSTLRPSPPPSPRASTSELPIPLELPSISDSSAVLVTNEGDDQDLEKQSDHSAADVLDTDGENGERGRTRSGDTGAGGAGISEQIEAVFTSERRGEPPRIGILPPSRKGSRKGKSRADDSARFESLDADSFDEKKSDAGVNDTLPFHDQSPSKAITLVDDRPTWPFVARLARTWPFRFTASIYLLIRRFLSLFGLSHPPRPRFNSLLAPLSTEDPEKSPARQQHLTATIVSLSVSSTPSASVPPSPSALTSPYASTIPRQVRVPRLTPKTLVLDLDETLIHSTSRPTTHGRGRNVPKGLKTTMVEVVLDGRSTMYTVYKRPWVDFFLRKVSSWYTVIIFTASLPEYADPVIDWLDGGDGRGGLIGGRLFRSHCLAKNGTYVKDLTVVDQDLAKVCLVDNSPVSYAINQANGIPIEGWINDPNDECLLDLLPMLDSLRFTNDVRRVLGLRGFGKASQGLSSASTPGTRRTPSTASAAGVGEQTARRSTAEPRRKP
ncbi:hypothetical protein JCM5353_000111 [Sporobolomyces roseus]